MTPKTRIKKAAVAHKVPNSKDEAAADIKLLGDELRGQLRIKTEMNDAIAAIAHNYQPVLEAFELRIAALQAGIQTWCEAHRSELLEKGAKTAGFVTGEVQWRARPPSVRITGAEAVLDTLQRLGLTRFVRVKEEVNKEAILNDPEAVKGVAGISIAAGVEDFVITPFEATA